jgi:xanthine dehydrogenase YagR molybdenum-binding subunit
MSMQETPHNSVENEKPKPQQAKVRYDGRLKVMGKATYAAEAKIPNVHYGYIVQSTIANGEITSMDTAAAERSSGVVAILTPFNAPPLPSYGKAAVNPPAGRHMSLLQDKSVSYNGQPIAVVVARSLPEAQFAASLIDIRYKNAPALLDFKGRLGEARPPKRGPQAHPDDAAAKVAAAVQSAAVSVVQTYTTPIQNHNPMEPHATIAVWNGDSLTLYDSTQYVIGDAHTVAKTLGLPADSVRVISPFVGGGFGCKGSTWSHVVLAAMAAKVANKPVKIALDRTQMFGPVGARPGTVQSLKLAADTAGTLTGMAHDAVMNSSVMEEFIESSAEQTKMLYKSPVVATSYKLVDVNYGISTFQRAPGESTGTFALESAMDELACKLKMDPVELRLKNYAETNQGEKKPFSSKHLRECYQQAGERFGWAKRTSEPGSMKDGDLLIGWGMATATYPANRQPAQASAKMSPDGRVTVSSGTQDIGTGMYTLMQQVAADTLGIALDAVEVKLGDSSLPPAPVSGGSMSTASVTPAVQEAAVQLKLKLVQLAINDAQSPLHGAQEDDITADGGKLVSKKTGASDPYTAILTRNGNTPLEAKGSAEASNDAKSFSAHSFGAVFVEVAVDPYIHTIKVRRVVGTYDIGTLMNQKTGMNQLVGGVVWGISMALHEETKIDPVYGRTVNENLAEYHVPVNADIGEIDVNVVGIPDTAFNPLGGRGIGEIGITGVAAAVANAVYHATGTRVRDLPITLDKLMA